jgi:hypothetical protein
VFDKTKKEVHEAVSEDFRKYMTSATYNISDAKKALNTGSQLQGEQLIGDRFKNEWDHLRRFTVNSVYNFYAEGVLNRYVLRL